MLKAALWYYRQGFCIIPARPNKRPWVSGWKKFQDERPTEDEIRSWWAKHPKANIAIICGKLSNLTVIDLDSDQALESLQEFLPDSLLIPTVKTPKGWHYYFQYFPKVGNGVKVLGDCDIRTEGGYVIAPPSRNGSGKEYAWVEGLSIKNLTPPEMPSFLKDTLLQYNINTSTIESKTSISLERDACFTLDSNKLGVLDSKTHAKKDPSETIVTDSNNRNSYFEKGRRDNDLFHTANCLVKGGMRLGMIEEVIEILAKNCKPPFSSREAETKIKSALLRANRRDEVTMGLIREFVSVTDGNFSVTNLLQMVTSVTPNTRAKIRVYLKRLKDEGVIEKVGMQDGVYRRIDTELNRINIFESEQSGLQLKYPLDLHEYFRTLPRNIIVIAGSQDAGKTCFLLNFAIMNCNRGLPVRYITSEMGKAELRERCRLFEPDIPFESWKSVEFCDHSTNFADKIEPNGINIVDYYEISDAFYTIGGGFMQFHEKLENGIVVIAIQKDPRSDLGRGASFGLEKPRLYVTLTSNPPEGNIAKIIKCKNWVRSDLNPNNLECVFKIIKGHEIRMQVPWGLPTKHLKGTKDAT